MKAITIKQPFASLIVAGLKEYEFRTWKTKYRGQILIHAGKGIDKKAMKKFEEYGLDYPSGCIIAKVNLTDCIKVDEEFRKVLYEKNAKVYSNIIKHTEWEGYGFKIDNIEKIKPIPAKGKLSIWEYDCEDNLQSQMLELTELPKDKINIYYGDYAPSLIPDKYIVSIHDFFRMASKIEVKGLDTKDEIGLLEETLCWLEDNIDSGFSTFIKSCRRKFEELVN